MVYRLVVVALVAMLCCGSVGASPFDLEDRDAAVGHLEELWQWIASVFFNSELGQFIEPNGEPELGQVIEPNGDELSQFIEPNGEPENGNATNLGEMIEPNG